MTRAELSTALHAAFGAPSYSCPGHTSWSTPRGSLTWLCYDKTDGFVLQLNGKTFGSTRIGDADRGRCLESQMRLLLPWHRRVLARVRMATTKAPRR